MPCISSTLRAEAQARIERNKALLVKAEAAFEAALDAQVQSYQFDSGEASQRTTHRKLSELQDTIDRLNGLIRADEEFLSGAGITTLNLRRKRYVRRWTPYA